MWLQNWCFMLLGLAAGPLTVGSNGPPPAAPPQGGQTPNDCSREARRTTRPPGYSLVCDLRTINSEFDTTNFSVIPSVGTVALSIR